MTPEERAEFVKMHGRAPSSVESALLAADPKTGAGKANMARLPWRALEAVSRVMDAGASIIGPDGQPRGYDSWKRGFESGDPDLFRESLLKYLSAALRHISAELRGQRVDESGELSVAHAACDLLFVLEMLESQRSR